MKTNHEDVRKVKRGLAATSYAILQSPTSGIATEMSSINYFLNVGTCVTNVWVVFIQGTMK